MAKKNSIALKLENHIASLEAQLSKLQEDLAIAKANHEKYLANRDVIESILGLHEAPDLAKPKRRPYKKRAPKE